MVLSDRVSPATTQGWQPTLLCKMCIPVLTFQKTFGPITFGQIIESRPNCYHGLPSSTAWLLQNNDSQTPILSAQRPHMCAWVRLSFPYYRVRTSALTPDGGLIKGVGSLSVGLDCFSGFSSNLVWPLVVVYRLKSVEAIKMKFVAPMPEQIATTTIHFLCWGPNLFWHGCNESQIFGPQTIDYRLYNKIAQTIELHLSDCCQIYEIDYIVLIAKLLYMTWCNETPFISSKFDNAVGTYLLFRWKKKKEKKKIENTRPRKHQTAFISFLE